MVNSSPQARVFISCGPQKVTDEIEVAHKIAEKLSDKGFEPYIGQEDGTLKGLKENTLKRLGASEYLILVHFKNERIFKPREDGTLLDTGKHRGSILSHEVFAVSAACDVDFLVFEEQGIKEDERISRLVEVDFVEFTDRHGVSDLVVEKVEEKKWNPKWRNELTLEAGKKDFEDTPHISMQEKSFRYYYVRAKNYHHDKIAYQCAAYLEKVKILSTGEEREFDLMEFKWKGITTERVVIPPTRDRAFDAFRLRYDSPSVAYFGINQLLIDYTGYLVKYSLAGPGDFEVTFIVFSENFPPARETFKLHIGTKLDDVEFAKVSREETSP